MRLYTPILLIIAYLLACTTSTAQQMKQISNEELIQLMENENLQLVDVRTPEEVQQGIIKGAQNIDYRNAKFESNIAKLDKKKPIAVYCGSGGRSGRTGNLLLELGFSEIYDLTGGFSLWEAEKHPVSLPK